MKTKYVRIKRELTKAEFQDMGISLATGTKLRAGTEWEVKSVSTATTDGREIVYLLGKGLPDMLWVYAEFLEQVEEEELERPWAEIAPRIADVLCMSPNALHTESMFERVAKLGFKITVYKGVGPDRECSIQKEGTTDVFTVKTKSDLRYAIGACVAKAYNV